MAAPDQRTYTLAEAVDLVAANATFVERAIGAGAVPTVSPGRLDAAGLRALRMFYAESGRALVDLMQSTIDEGWYDISIERMGELGIGEADKVGGTESWPLASLRHLRRPVRSSRCR